MSEVVLRRLSALSVSSPADANKLQDQTDGNACAKLSCTNDKVDHKPKGEPTNDDHSAYAALLSESLPHQVEVDWNSMLGEGSFGAVFGARWRRKQRSAPAEVVVKVVGLDGLAQQARRQIWREVALHSKVKHAHICPLVGAYEAGPDEVHLVLGACVGDLACPLAANEPWVASAAPWLVRSLLLALQHLHEALQVVHSDVKPDNLLLTSSGVLQLADLGAAAMLQGRCEGGRSTLVGAPAYQAPEVVVIDELGLAPGGARYSFAADVWSSGVVLYELLCRKLPFSAGGDGCSAQRAAIVFAPLLVDEEAIPSGAARRLLHQLLAKQPFLRPSAAEALESAFVSEAVPPSPSEAEAWAASVRGLRDECLGAVGSDGDSGDDGEEEGAGEAGEEGEAVAAAGGEGEAGCEETPARKLRGAAGVAAGCSPGDGSSSCDGSTPGPPSWTSSLVGGSPVE